MKKEQILRAWKDPNYRRGLSPEELEKLPEHPAAWMTDVDDDVLTSVSGGCCPWNPPPPSFCTVPCPPYWCAA